MFVELNFSNIAICLHCCEYSKCCCVVWFVSKEEIKTVEERERVGEDEREMINK